MSAERTAPPQESRMSFEQAKKLALLGAELLGLVKDLTKAKSLAEGVDTVKQLVGKYEAYLSPSQTDAIVEAQALSEQKTRDQEVRALLFLPTSSNKWSFHKGLRDRLMLDEQKQVKGGRLLGMIQTIQGWRKTEQGILSQLKSIATNTAYAPESKAEATDIRKIMDGVLTKVAAENPKSLLHSKSDGLKTDKLGYILKYAERGKLWTAEQPIVGGIALFAAELQIIQKPIIPRGWLGADNELLDMRNAYQALPAPQQEGVRRFLSLIADDLGRAMHVDVNKLPQTTDQEPTATSTGSVIRLARPEAVAAAPTQPEAQTETVEGKRKALLQKLKKALVDSKAPAISADAALWNDFIDASKHLTVTTEPNYKTRTEFFIKIWKQMVKSPDATVEKINKVERVIEMNGLEDMVRSLVLSAKYNTSADVGNLYNEILTP